MTQEEKAKAYDEALEMAKQMLPSKRPWTIVEKRAFEKMFPELKESEDGNFKNKSGYYKAGKFWKASTLWEAVKNKTPQRVENRYVLQHCSWNIGTLREFAEEMRNVQEVSLDYPIILDINGHILDGAHRVVKAYLEGKDIDIVYLGDDEWPEPDYDEEKAIKESKDERIRKWIIEELEITRDAMSGKHPYSDDPDIVARLKRLDEAIAYLEKQKELNVVPSRETILGIWELGNLWKENPEERDGLTQLQYIQKYWFEKCDYIEKEQNRAEIAPNYFDGITYGMQGHSTAKPAEDWKEKRKKECPFRKTLDNNLYGCEQYADVVCACTGNCSWVVDYPKLKEIQDRKEQKPLLPEDKVKHPLYMEGFEAGKEVGRQCEKVFGKQKGKTIEGFKFHINLKKAKENKYVRAQLLWELMHDGIITEVDYQYLTDDKRKPWSAEEYRIAYQEGFEMSEQLKQKEQKVDTDKLRKDIYQSGYNDGYQHGKEDAQKEYKSADLSEEDEKMIKSILFVLESYVSKSESTSSPSLITTYPTYYKEIDWLKFLPNRVTLSNWKPTEEQMKALSCVVAMEWDSHYGEELKSLYSELKKRM